MGSAFPTSYNRGISSTRSWLQHLISVTFDFNRGRVHELEQVLVGTYSGANRNLEPEVFVNSLTAPHKITTATQKQIEMVCAQNLLLSGNDKERNNYIDDSERMAAAANGGDDQSTTLRF